MYMIGKHTIPHDFSDENAHLDHGEHVNNPGNALAVRPNHTQLAEANLALLVLPTSWRVIDVVVHFDILSRAVLEGDVLGGRLDLGRASSCAIVGSIWVVALLRHIATAAACLRSGVYRINMVVEYGIER